MFVKLSEFSIKTTWFYNATLKVRPTYYTKPLFKMSGGGGTEQNMLMWALNTITDQCLHALYTCRGKSESHLANRLCLGQCGTAALKEVQGSGSSCCCAACSHWKHLERRIQLANTLRLKVAKGKERQKGLEEVFKHSVMHYSVKHAMGHRSDRVL